MKNRLVFLEFEDETELYFNRAKREHRNRENDSVVILSPNLRPLFARQGFPCLNTLSFFDNRSHERALEKSEEWLRLFESVLDPGNAGHREFIFKIRFILNSLLWTSEVIVSAVEKLHPTEICCPSAEPCFGPGPNLSSRDRFLGSMVAEYAREREISIEVLDGNSKNSTPEYEIKIEHTRPSPGPGRGTILARWVRWGYRLFSNGNRFVLAATSAYGLDRVLKNQEIIPPDYSLMMLDLRPETGTAGDITGTIFGLAKNWIRPRRGRFFKSLPALHFPACNSMLKETQKLEETLLSLADRMEGEWRSVFSYRGISLARQAAGKLRGGIRSHLIELSHNSARLHTALKTVRPAVVISTFNVGHAALLGDLCKKMNIPSVLIPHGSLLSPKNQWEEIEWRRLSHAQMLSPYTYTTAQSLLAAGHADYYRVSPPAWKTGPVLFSRTDRKKGEDLRRRLNLSEDTRVIIYASAQRKRSSIRFYIFETEDEYLSSLSDIVQAVNRMEKTHLILKLHPSCSFPEDRMRSFLPESSKVTILRDDAFSEVLAAGDLLVSYISTTIEEALFNRVPVVLYDKWKRFSFFEALNCGGIESAGWQAAAGYYIEDPDLLTGVLHFALDHASQAAGDDSLYSPFIIPKNQQESFSRQINKFISPAACKDKG